MKILYAYNQQRGGSGANNAAQAAIAALRRDGLEVEVFTRDSKELPLNMLGRVRAAANAFYAPAAVSMFARLLASFRPDLVHVHELFPLISPRILPLCTQSGVPVVMSCDDYHLTCPVRTHLYDRQICTRCTGGHEYWAVLKNCRRNLPESMTFALYNAMTRWRRLFGKHVDYFIAPSEFTRRWLIEHAGIDAAQISAIAPIVDIPESAADPASGNYVGFAGRLVPEKGIDTLLEAARISRLPLRLSRHEKHFETVPIPSDVDVVVTRNRQDLEAFYRGARILVLPSIWWETFGLAGAEAMSHGVPVVVSRIGALSCLVDDGVDGLYFEPDNALDLADKLAGLWDDMELCKRLGQAGRRKAIAWSAERHVERLMAIYEDVCRRKLSLSRNRG
jgi:glycosyltransferase involved in cell wall biosynthesis